MNFAARGSVADVELSSVEKEQERTILGGKLILLYPARKGANRVGSEAREDRAPEKAASLDFKSFAEGWVDRRVAEGLRCQSGYRSILRKHLVPEFGTTDLASLTRKQYRDFLSKLRQNIRAPRTIVNVSRLLHRILEDAVEDGLLELNPARPARNDIPKQRDSVAGWRLRARFSREEVIALLSDDRIPEKRRMSIALDFFTGRSGEAAAFRWDAWESGMKPLGRLVLDRAFCTTDREMRPPKNFEAREVPVHPALAKLLERWRARGWERAYGRKPRPNDLIIASRRTLADDRVWPVRNDRAWKWLQWACDTLHIRRRGVHCLRATLISLAQEDGANAAIMERVTHNSPSGVHGGRVFAGYSRFSFTDYCREVSKLRIELPTPSEAQLSLFKDD